MDYNTYLNKVHGGWIGKCIGGAAGAPVEGIKEIIDIKDYKEIIRPDLPNDDLDLQLLWLYVIQEKGWSITSKDLADAWKKHCWYPFNEYGYFLKNYNRGIMPPLSGSFNNEMFAESEGCPIRSEIWGMTCPNDPEKAAYYAGLDGCLDHAGEAIWIEQYYAAIEAKAFVESDCKKLLFSQLEYLPNNSRSRNCVIDMFEYFEKEPELWEKARTYLMKKYGHYDFTNAVVNLGIVIIALLYGRKDIDKTINIAFRCGFDTDCTCATAGAILGIILGEKGISEDLKKLVSDEFVIGIDVPRDNNSILKLSEETCEVGLKEKNIKKLQLDLKVYYDRYPSIGSGDTCNFCIEIINNSDIKIADTLQILDIPEEFHISKNNIKCTLEAGEKKRIDFIITTKKEISINNTNILKVLFGKSELEFGIAGASEWSAVGPFFEALKKEDPIGMLSAHPADCVLPTLECMVNNAAYIDKEYINERNFESEFLNRETLILHAYEDLIPVQENFGIEGQMCVYLRQIVESDIEQEVWAVIGNSDGFKMWINGIEYLCKDETRLWTPYNNYIIVPLKKGKNEIVIKLLRRTEEVKFSFGLRTYEGNHFHRMEWITNLKSSVN